MYLGFCIYGVDIIHQKSSLNGQEPNDHSTRIRLLTEKVSKIIANTLFSIFSTLRPNFEFQCSGIQKKQLTMVEEYSEFRCSEMHENNRISRNLQ